MGREVGADSQDVGEPGKSKQLLGTWIMEMGFLEPSSLGCAELGASGGIQVDMSWSRAGPRRDQRLSTQVGELAQGNATQDSGDAEARP